MFDLRMYNEQFVVVGDVQLPSGKRKTSEIVPFFVSYSKSTDSYSSRSAFAVYMKNKGYY